MSFNENTRVKIPAILHLCRLGYTYLPLSKATWDLETNIFPEIFTRNVLRLNPDMSESDANRLLVDLSLTLDNEDLGHAFYLKLTEATGSRLLDLQDFSNNEFHVVTELPCQNGEETFRPDITLLVNGMPLAFVEVKKPNNQEGVLAERNRMAERLKNKKFRKFVNISQILAFSNNMEYDDDPEPIQGAFYATPSYGPVVFNYFREEEKLDLTKILKDEDGQLENVVLKDNNLSVIKHAPEFQVNKDPNTPTNRLLTSLFSKERFGMLLKYGIAYVKEEKGIEKHIMRYPQLFATKAIAQKLDEGNRKGIIWHTQGSGKTALAYYNVKYLTDYFHAKGIVPQFFFIVDRLDLLNQAKKEFSGRGLVVHTINNKDQLAENFKTRKAIHNLAGKREISVVNIQKFGPETALKRADDYDIRTQRVYFLDEVHRSYDPKGSFLANLFTSDPNAILIGLTGTPLIKEDRTSRQTFGDYIHKYYYNASIADGYTLRLIREEIETSYKLQLAEVLREIGIPKGGAEKEMVYAHPRFVEPMLDYIVENFVESRKVFNDHTIGAMVVCDSSQQARELFKIFVSKYNPEQKTLEPTGEFLAANEPAPVYETYQLAQKRALTASLILHDIGEKEERKQEIEDFKDGKIDILFVYSMLLTGFDAKRLKKLYLARVVRDHNLLQTLTRVNRPYKQFRYGYVVDFADISKEFEETNRAYFDELKAELGDEMEHYSNLFKSKEEIEEDIKEIQEKLFLFDLKNLEIFSQQISQISDRKQMLGIKKALETLKNLYNVIRLSGNYDLLSLLDFGKIGALYNEAVNHLNLLNLKESIENKVDNTNLLNSALENVIFMFRKISEEEMIIADELKDSMRKTREALAVNFDQQDPEWITLYEELKRIFDKKNLDELGQNNMTHNIAALEKIYARISELNRRNNLLKAKYDNDAKYARLHKRILEKGDISKKESEICDTLMTVKAQVDDKVLLNNQVLANESYFEKLMLQMVVGSFTQKKVKLDPPAARFINNCLLREYMNEYNGRYAV